MISGEEILFLVQKITSAFSNATSLREDTDIELDGSVLFDRRELDGPGGSLWLVACHDVFYSTMIWILTRQSSATES